MKLAETAGDSDHGRLEVAQAIGDELAQLDPIDSVRAFTMIEHLVDPVMASVLRASVVQPLSPAQRVAVLVYETTGPEGEPSESVPWFTWEGLLGALIDAANEGERLVPQVPYDSARTQAWAYFLELVRPIGTHMRYVGEFKKRFDVAAEFGETFAGRDRLIAARFLIDRTAFSARTWNEFMEGVRVATSLDDALLAPATVIQNVVWPCLPYYQEPPALTPAVHAIRLAFEVMAPEDKAFITGANRRRLATIVETLSDEERALVLELSATLHKDDKRAVAGILDPSQAKRRFFGRKR